MNEGLPNNPYESAIKKQMDAQRATVEKKITETLRSRTEDLESKIVKVLAEIERYKESREKCRQSIRDLVDDSDMEDSEVVTQLKALIHEEWEFSNMIDECHSDITQMREAIEHIKEEVDMEFDTEIRLLKNNRLN